MLGGAWAHTSPPKCPPSILYPHHTSKGSKAAASSPAPLHSLCCAESLTASPAPLLGPSQNLVQRPSSISCGFQSWSIAARRRHPEPGRGLSPPSRLQQSLNHPALHATNSVSSSSVLFCQPGAGSQGGRLRGAEGCGTAGNWGDSQRGDTQTHPSSFPLAGSVG